MRDHHDDRLSDAGEVPWTGHYDKEHYVVLMPDGERVLCWPNAGLMNACDGSGRMWKPDGVVRVERIDQTSPEHPLNKYSITDGPPDETTRTDEPTRARKRVPAVLGAALSLAGMSLHVPDKPPCTHGFGLAGGFSECSACGITARSKRKR